MTLQDQIDLLTAIRNGKTLEFRPKGSNNTWLRLNSTGTAACFFETQYEYRIKPEPMVRYINIYPDGHESWYNTKEEADKAACSDRVCCVKLVEVLE